MNNDIILLSVLTAQEYTTLQLIHHIREKIKSSSSQKEEPKFTLQQNYIKSFLGFSPNTVVSAIDKLCTLKIISEISNKYGECATYQFNVKEYRSLINKAKKQERTIITGRKKKTKQIISAETALNRIVGKSIIKNRLQQDT
ncbi:hypothetical protein D0T50_06235 [Bacteroides sp. 214]|uniref:hypothetical protein n=1 Tax=Bacteroides sp. 214 TaxID=2302935 RepID=UPI0013D71ABF|nr:hypothetical protein [Bacteroides sp. 214]NDW12488.1 hypothetical protein [Bacteroides sp. 214]